ncbi:MAG: amylo-alpha-1,6-glucosidase [Oligosphaeraceae bacterium]
MPSDTSSPASHPVLEQRPSPHARVVRHVGDSLRISLTLSRPVQGRAFVRTNLGHGEVQRQEIISQVEQDAAPLGRDWRDLPMRQTGAAHYEVRLPLTEVGVFSFMCLFQEENSGDTFWPRGENAQVKVISELYAAGNSIYNAFVRQFGENISGGATQGDSEQAATFLDSRNFTVIPPSGTFRNLQSRLDFIIGEMGFRILQFLPVHPTPTTFARMGRYGSPFAPLDFFDVDASMAEFDQRTTPLEQFLQLVDQVHARGAKVFLDLPIDHTGWASVLQSHHPEWFARTPDGAFQSPGAWGVVWADLCKLDFSHKELWRRLAEVFLHWCRNGVDGFRCDAGYMIPAPVWKYIVAKVRQQFPDTLFFLEGLGGGQEATTRLLEDADLDWAYSELFQNYSSQEMGRYLEFSSAYSAAHGALVHFAETHDNARLAEKSPAWARLRVALCALFAPAGCFGIANGVEWYATEKIDVHGARSLNWGAQENMVPLLTSLNALLKSHPAFRCDARLRVPYGAGGSAVGLLREPRGDGEHTLLVVVNPRTDEGAEYHWHFQEFDPGSRPVDLLTGKPLPATLQECLYHVRLKPGQVLCLCRPGRQNLAKTPYGPVERQQLRATALRLRVSLQGMQDLGNVQAEDDAYALFQDPREFLAKLAGEKKYLPLVEWSPEQDGHRQVLLPVDHYVLISHGNPFQVQISMGGVVHEQLHSVPRRDGRHFAFLLPFGHRVTRPAAVNIRLTAYAPEHQVNRFQASGLVLPVEGSPSVLRRITRRELTPRHSALATNCFGSYGLVRGMWGSLEGQYDALLAVNQNPRCPSDRTMVLARVRGWLIHHDFAQEIHANCQVDFAVTERNAASWHFIVPSGMGGNAYLAIRYEMEPEENRCRLIFTRCPPPEEADAFPSMDANSPITLILRPDVDDCCTHDPTLAFQGAERRFPQKVTPAGNGFVFSLDSGNRLEARMSRGVFLKDGEWNYNLHNALEAERGLRANRDLYSPGHFRLELKRGEAAVLEAAVLPPGAPPLPTPGEPRKKPPFHERNAQVGLRQALEEAMEAFVVNREERKTVIAGYPWFLDWGRDTLICLRGLAAAGRLEDVAATILQFASFEEQGTLPNMISGENVSNRDTVDAPLWLFNAVGEYGRFAGKKALKTLLETPCGSRTLLQVLESIVQGYRQGTPNGIVVDPASMLVFSPSHFTWMDTNFPAGTPREGYPVEIQALWHQALVFLETVTGKGEYGQWANQVRQSLLAYYPSREDVGLSDCLHAAQGTPAAQAVADDACRPNQLFALTMPGLVPDPALRRRVICATGHLLVPGGIRTLADQKVEVLQPIYKDGHLLNNPSFPYWGEYKGDEDTRRKPAYHNGTAWPWVMPSFGEALLQTYGASARGAVQALLHTTAMLLRRGCLGQLPEILDGDAPHRTRGCCAQAWSVTEAYRLVRLWEDMKE